MVDVTPIPKPPKREKTRLCRNCGKPYEVYPSQVRHRGSSYCSMACRRAAEIPKRRNCEYCGDEFVPHNPGTPGTGRFCSRQCWRASRKEVGYPTRPRTKPTLRVEFACSSCGRVVSIPRAWAKKKAKKRYCSRACAGAGRTREGTEPQRGYGWRAVARRIRERDGACVRCGGSDTNRQLSVDHVLPWVLVKAWPELANNPANLASLCVSCHGIKTTVIEPRLLRGDFLALQEFYGRERSLAAQRLFDPIEAEKLGLVIR